MDEAAVSSFGPDGGPWGGIYLLGNFKNSLKEGTGCGVSLSMEPLLGEPGREKAPLLAALKVV
jgi:hypothetical protein